MEYRFPFRSPYDLTIAFAVYFLINACNIHVVTPSGISFNEGYFGCCMLCYFVCTPGRGVL